MFSGHMQYAMLSIGARMHYAVPRILQRADMLDTFFTGAYATERVRRRLGLLPRQLLPPFLRRWGGRHADGIPEEKIVSFSGLDLRQQWRLRQCRSRTEAHVVNLRYAQRFCEAVLRYGLGDADGVFAYDTAALELLEHARKLGLRAVMEQTVAPRDVVNDHLVREYERHPTWEEKPSLYPQEVIKRERAEWGMADVIVCGSHFVQENIQKIGGRHGTCRVVPYGIAAVSTSGRPDEAAAGRAGAEAGKRRLRVLTVGTVCLRKGSPYVLAAARKLKAEAEFRMVGSVEVSPAAQRELAEHLQLTGPVPRSDMAQHFKWADVFLLPSTCEGSATVTYEALAFGLPVICTPNTGSVIRDGEDGFIVPVGDATAIAERLMDMIQSRSKLGLMSALARQNSANVTLEAYQKRLEGCLQ